MPLLCCDIDLSLSLAMPLLCCDIDLSLSLCYCCGVVTHTRYFGAHKLTYLHPGLDSVIHTGTCNTKAWAMSQHTDTSNTKAWAMSQHTDTSNNKAWAMSQHTDTSKNTKAWAVSQHTDTKEKLRLHQSNAMCCTVMWGLSPSTISPLLNSTHPL